MTAGPGKPPLEERDEASQYTPDDAAEPLQRLAAALSDRYAFDRLIGRGGAAFVYLVRDLRDDRLTALKVLRPDFSYAVAEARFHREIEIAHRLHHPNILPLLDFGTVDGLIYFTMPYIDGDTLRVSSIFKWYGEDYRLRARLPPLSTMPTRRVSCTGISSHPTSFLTTGAYSSRISELHERCTSPRMRK